MNGKFGPEAEYDDFDPDFKSKTKVKREFIALQELGRRLIESPRVRIQDLDVDDRVKNTVLKARGLKKQAMKRQIQYLGGLLQHEDSSLLQEYLEALDKPHQSQVSEFHDLEEMRDALLTGEGQAVEDAVAQFELADRQYLRQLVRNSQREAQKNQPPKSARLIFKYLRELQEGQAS